jgi:hypothetical protein
MISVIDLIGGDILMEMAPTSELHEYSSLPLFLLANL